ncbi:MAG TPA: hypothetical protein VIK02_06700 [Candidatus Anoxymicrobiaceae bacterium]
MTEMIFTVSVIAFAVIIFVLIARAILADIHTAVRLNAIERASTLGMDPVQKELQRTLVVGLCARMEQARKAVARDETRHTRAT